MASGIVDWVFLRTDWAEFIAHTEVFWQSEGYAAALWSGTYSGEPYVFPNIEVEDRTMVNMRLGMEGIQVGDGTLRAGIWAKNLLDESTTLLASTLPASVLSPTSMVSRRLMAWM